MDTHTLDTASGMHTLDTASGMHTLETGSIAQDIQQVSPAASPASTALGFRV